MDDAFQDLVNDNFKFYKKVSDDPAVSKEFFARLFEWYLDGRKKTPPKKAPEDGAAGLVPRRMPDTCGG